MTERERFYQRRMNELKMIAEQIDKEEDGEEPEFIPTEKFWKLFDQEGREFYNNYK